MPVQPKVEVVDWQQLEVGRPEAEVPEELISQELDALRESVAELVPADDRPAQEGDTLVVDIVSSDGEAQRDTVVELGSGRLVPEIEVVAFTPEPPEAAPAENVSPVAGAGALPFRPRAFRGAALTGGAADALLPEALRVLQPGARVVIDPAPPGTAERAAALGAAVLLDQEGVVVARALGDPVPLRMNAIR